MRVKLKFAAFDGKVLHERGIVENWSADVPLPKTAVSLDAPEPEPEAEPVVEPKGKALPKSGV